MSNPTHDFDLSADDEIECSISEIEFIDKQELTLLAQNFIALRLKAEQATRQISGDDRHFITNYLKLGVSKEKQLNRTFLGEIDYLVNIAKHFAAMINTDKKAMASLALDDPGAYAKMLSYRRKYTKPDEALGDYNKNLLSDFLTSKKQTFNKDHEHWFNMCESKKLENRSARVSLPLCQLLTTNKFDK